MKKGAKGFTVTEVMIAVFLFALGMVGIFGLTGTLLRLNAFADRVSTAATLAEAKIEELRSEDPLALSSGSDSVDVFQRIWSVSTNSLPWYRTVSVTVGWQNLQGAAQQVTFNTILAE